MAHYLQIHSLDKKFTKGVKVLDFTEFKEPMVKFFETPWTFMNDTVRKYFNAESDSWDAHYFVLCYEDPQFIIDELQKLWSRYDLDQEEAELIGLVSARLEEVWKDIGSETTGYVISWSK